MAYITGEAWLGHLCFKSDARALVPRSPVAELVLNQFEPWYQGPDPQVIIDVCCGGGASACSPSRCFHRRRCF